MQRCKTNQPQAPQSPSLPPITKRQRQKTRKWKQKRRRKKERKRRKMVKKRRKMSLRRPYSRIHLESSNSKRNRCNTSVKIRVDTIPSWTHASQASSSCRILSRAPRVTARLSKKRKSTTMMRREMKTLRIQTWSPTSTYPRPSSSILRSRMRHESIARRLHYEWLMQ